MDDKRLTAALREYCRREYCPAPEPGRKAEFFRKIEKEGLADRRPFAMSQAEFLLGQFSYIDKRVWLLSAAVLLLIIVIGRSAPGNELFALTPSVPEPSAMEPSALEPSALMPFALTPLLAAGILAETGRSYRFKMAELEYTARFSLRSVMLARLFVVGTVDTAGILIAVWAVLPRLSYSLLRVFLYMMVPYLSACLLGSLYERKHRADNGWGSIAICILSSAFFAAAPFVYSRLYEERLTILWAAAFALLVCGLAGSMRKWACGMEGPVWN